MTDEEKVNLIDSLEDVDELTCEHFKFLNELSFDDDDFVRSRCAALLINFENDSSMNLLLHLIEDEDPLVRTEAYDSLSVFRKLETKNAMFNAMKKEKDCLARSFAILSWVDISIALSHIEREDIDFLKKFMSQEQSERCILSCFYGLYLFGDKNYFVKILSFLQNEDYQLRCSALNLLMDLVDAKNIEETKKSITPLSTSDENAAVRDMAQRLLKELSQ
jgi:HEAT repeat protein